MQTVSAATFATGIPPLASVEAGSLWWARRSTMLAFMILSTVPLWFTSTPPLIDFVGHLARYHIALNIGHSAELARNWSYDWALIGNLGVDILIIPLARLVGLERAGWMVAVMLPPLMIWGVFRAARAVYGALPPVAIATLPFALAYPYQFGFVNYWLGAALAFHAFAWWVILRGRPRVRSALFVPVGLLIWLCHVYGWAILGVLVGGYELSRASRAERRELLRWGISAVARTWPLLTVIAPMVIWRSNGEGAESLGWFDMPAKLHAAILTLRDQWKALDVVTVGACVFLIHFGLRNADTKIDARFGMASLIFTAALLCLPYQLFGSAFADTRVYPFLFIAAILSIRLSDDATGARLARLIPVSFAALFAVRVAGSALGYAEYDAAYKRHLRALDFVEPGASVAVLVGTPCHKPWRLQRVDHLASMAILRRDTFVNLQWDGPGTSLLRPRRALGTGWSSDPSQSVVDASCPTDLRPALSAAIQMLPRQHFDFVWVFNFEPRHLSRYRDLSPLYSDDNSILYRVDKSGL